MRYTGAMINDLRYLEGIARRQAALTGDPRTREALLEMAAEFRERIESHEREQRWTGEHGPSGSMT